MCNQPTTPPPEMTESEVCKWLQSKGLLKPDPFDGERLDNAGKAAWLRKLCNQLGHRYAGCTLDNFDCKEYPEDEKWSPHKMSALSIMRHFSKTMPDQLRGGGGLLLYGHPGTGKDHLTAALLKIAVAVHGITAYWIDGGNLYDRVAEAATSEDHQAIRRLQAELCEPLILAISDPQPPKGDLNPTQSRRIRDLIDRRYRDGKSTWMTTNLDNKQHAETLLTRPVLDRLKHGSTIIDCNWPSYRSPK